MKFHVVAGLPRSGSTLLMNLLAQNPEFYADNVTSDLAALIAATRRFLSVDNPTTKTALINGEGEARILRIFRGNVEAYAHPALERGTTYICKAREWVHLYDTFRVLSAGGTMVVIHRDLREVFASIEAGNSAFPLLNDAHTPTTLMGRANLLFSPEGLVGSLMAGIEDLIRMDEVGRADRVAWVSYQRLATYPEETIKDLYDAMGEDMPGLHQFEDVLSTAKDEDALYLRKFIHDGGGKVEPSARKWQDWLPREVADRVRQAFPLYCSRFGYQ